MEQHMWALGHAQLAPHKIIGILLNLSIFLSQSMVNTLEAKGAFIEVYCHPTRSIKLLLPFF